MPIYIPNIVDLKTEILCTFVTLVRELDWSVSFNVSLQGRKTVRRHTDHMRPRTEQQICVPILQDTTDETPLVDPQSSVNQPSLEPSNSSPSVNSPPDTSSVDPPSDQSSSTELTTQRYPKRTRKPPDCFFPKF